MGRPPIGRNVDSRTRLLNSLGLFQPGGQQQRDEGKTPPGMIPSRVDGGRDGTPSSNHLTDSSSSSSSSSENKKYRGHVRSRSDIPARSALHNTVAFQTKLNDESVSVTRSQKERRTAPRRSSFSDKNKSSKSNNNNNNTTNTSCGVRFNTVVSGVKIPSRNQYSSRIKQTLWRDRYELSEMVERNTTEFHAENYDWHQVVLDDEMYVDSTSGERVHPCHVEGSSFDDHGEDDDDDDYDDSFGDGPGFSPLTRSDSIVAEKSL